MNLQNGIIIVGSRNQRPSVYWPGVAMSAVIVAVVMAAGYCGVWYLLTRELPDLPRLVGSAVFVTVLFVGGGIRKGLSTPVAQLRSLD